MLYTCCDCRALLRRCLPRAAALRFPGRGRLPLGAVVLNLPERSLGFLRAYRRVARPVRAPVFYVEAFTRHAERYADDVALRACLARLGARRLRAAGGPAVRADDCGCDAFGAAFLRAAAPRIARARAALMRAFAARLVRDVGTGKYMVCAEFAFRD